MNNERAFAITSIIYAMLLLFFMLMILIMMMLSRRKVMVDKAKNDVINELSFTNRSVDFTKSNSPYTFYAFSTGYYKIELWGSKNTSCSSNCLGGAYTQATFFLNKDDALYLSVDSTNDGTTRLLASDGVTTVMNAGSELNPNTFILGYLNCTLNSGNEVCTNNDTQYSLNYPSIIMPGKNMPDYLGVIGSSRRNEAHAKITYVSTNTPKNYSVDTYFTKFESDCDLDETISVNTNNITVSNNKNEMTIYFPNKGYAFDYSIPNSRTVIFCSNLDNRTGCTKISNSGNHLINNSGYIIVSGSNNNATTKFKNITFNGQYVTINKLPVRSLNPIYCIGSWTSIASSSSKPGGCISIDYGNNYTMNMSKEVYTAINSTNNFISSQIKYSIGNTTTDWTDMNNGSYFHYSNFNGIGLYRIKTRQKYTGGSCPENYLSQETNEFVFSTSNG